MNASKRDRKALQEHLQHQFVLDNSIVLHQLAFPMQCDNIIEVHAHFYRNFYIERITEKK